MKIATTALQGPVSPQPDFDQGLDDKSFNPDSSPIATVVIPGNPALGTVLYYRQTHGNRSANPLPHEVRIGNSQAVLLRDLIARGISDVFQESLTETIRPGDPDRADRIDEARTREIFPGGAIPESLSSTQAMHLRHSFLGNVYAGVNSSVTVHATNTPERERKFDSIIDDPEMSKTTRLEYTFDRREAATLEHIAAFFSSPENRGKTVALLYGAEHPFDKPIATLEESPVVIALTFPSALTKSNFDVTEDVKREQDPTRQLLLIHKAATIQGWIYESLMSEEARLAALPKLEVPFWYFSGADDLRLALINMSGACPSGRLANEIETLYREVRGPFEAFRLSSEGQAAIERARQLERYDVSELIRNEQHPYTQYLLIEAAPAISDWCFGSILSPSGQIAALKKLQRSIEHEPIEDIKRSLLSAARDDQVKATVVGLARKGEGIFATTDTPPLTSSQPVPKLLSYDQTNP